MGSVSNSESWTAADAAVDRRTVPGHRAAAWVRGLAGAALAFAVGLPALALEINIAPDGNDKNDGSSPAKAVATLDRAWALAKSKRNEPVTVLVRPGTYKGQSLTVDARAGLPPKFEILGRRNEQQDWPVFVGGGAPLTWLTWKQANGKPTGLRVEGIEIREYLTAISLDGNRDDAGASNSGTVIRDNVFRRIGSIGTDEDKLSTAVIRLVNSHDNLIEKNRFVTIRNKSGCDALHAVYVAHFSSGNRILGNTVEDTCGAVVKLRDRANDNVIEGNRFSKVEKAPAVQEWFCDKGARKGCTKALGECPSTGNVQRGNELNNSVGAKMVSIEGEKQPRGWCEKSDYGSDRVR